MRIGDLAKRSGTPVATIRFYEREGLLPVPLRSEGNYRIYSRQQAEQLAFIVRCRALDMSLDVVRVLLRFKDTPQADCTEVDSVLDEHIGQVASRLHELHALERDLRQLRARCKTTQPAGACGILAGLKLAAAETGPAAPR